MSAEYVRKYRAKLKREVMNAYGGKCIRCEVIDLRVLTLDHPNGDGKDDRLGTSGGWYTYLKLRREGYPKRVQVVCFNCHRIIEHERRGWNDYI
mgnify:CR=1 FL=1